MPTYEEIVYLKLQNLITDKSVFCILLKKTQTSRSSLKFHDFSWISFTNNFSIFFKNFLCPFLKTSKKPSKKVWNKSCQMVLQVYTFCFVSTSKGVWFIQMYLLIERYVELIFTNYIFNWRVRTHETSCYASQTCKMKQQFLSNVWCWILCEFPNFELRNYFKHIWKILNCHSIWKQPSEKSFHSAQNLRYTGVRKKNNSVLPFF